jgi:hypothetical protein
VGRRGAVRLEARVEVFGGLEGQAVLLQQRFEVCNAGLEVPDVAASWSVAEPRRMETLLAARRAVRRTYLRGISRFVMGS